MRSLNPRRMISSPLRKRRKSRKRGRKGSWAVALRRQAFRRPAVILASISISVFLATGTWLWASDRVSLMAHWAADCVIGLSADAGFYIDEVYLEGRTRTPREDVIRALKLYRGQPILALDLDGAREKLEALPWVRSADVARHLPRTLYIRLRERAPFAIWQRDGRLALIAANGDEISGVGIAAFGQLPLIVGVDVIERAAALVAMLAAEPVLAARVTAATRVGGRRWDVRLDGTVDVKLPEQDAQLAWSWLAAMEREHRLLDCDLVTLDLRLPDRLVVRLPELVTPEADGPADSPGHET